MFKRNRFHPKNIFKDPPNFKELAIEFPEFRKYVKQELSGRVSIDYQNPKAIKELTKTLLKKYFELDVDIDENRLIPRVPLCLNYVLWLEDLLNLLDTNSTKLGIDIGTGNVCIYSLLCAKKGWKMLATEIDHENFKSAESNIKKNNFNEMISLKFNPNPSDLLINMVDRNIVYDFCMCNPPFFDFSEKPSNRTSRRFAVKNMSSDIPSEICTEGGEVLFIKQLIKESLQLKSQIKIFTTLIGKKCDFLYLKKELKILSPKSQAFTEFYQGKTTRWGIAWSFFDISLKLNNCLSNKKKKKDKAPLSFIVPDIQLNNLEVIFKNIKNTFISLNISYEEKTDNQLMLTFKALKNTWSHFRRKKRLEARKNNASSDMQNKILHNVKSLCDDNVNDYECSSPKKVKKDLDDQEVNEDNAIAVEGFITLKTNNSPSTSAIIEMFWLSGNKESLHQIFQYLKNNCF